MGVKSYTYIKSKFEQNHVPTIVHLFYTYLLFHQRYTKTTSNNPIEIKLNDNYNLKKCKATSFETNNQNNINKQTNKGNVFNIFSCFMSFFKKVLCTV